jgi:uncharacterized protein (DUF2132 family)
MLPKDPRKTGLASRIQRMPSGEQANNPLHGVRLDTMIEELVAALGWEELGRRIKIRCFNHDPSVKSSLAFLRKTPWAREKVEQLYLRVIKKIW